MKEYNKIREVYTSKEWVEKVNATKGICPNCNKYIGVINLTLDHIHPISKAEKGRIYTIKDVQPLCMKCNSTKKDKLQIPSETALILHK